MNHGPDRLRKPDKGPPGQSIPLAPGALPLAGHTLTLLRNPWRFLTSLAALDSTLARMRLGPLDVIVVCDPGATHRLLRADRLFDKGGPLFDAARPVIGDTVLTAPSQEHRRQRRLVQPAFHHTRLPGYTTAMAAEAAAVTDRWTDGGRIAVAPEMLRLTTRVFLAAMYSESLPPPVLARATASMGTILAGLYRQMLMPSWLTALPTRRNRRYRRAWAEVGELVRRIAAERRMSGADHGDLLSSLLAARDGESASGEARLTDDEIANQLTTFVIAGSETTASTLAWSLYLLARHPAVLARVQAEVDRVLSDEPVDHSHVDALSETRCVLYEALRLYPPGWLLTRTTTVDTEFEGYRLRSGTAVVYSPYLLHHLEQEFADAERFDPARWARGADQERFGAFIPFGAGPRRCIGDSFAMAEATTVLATIVRRWAIEINPAERVRPALAATLRPRNFWLRVHARTGQRRELL
nr:cytochrome P450 [Kibdelosporangium sp. MJ126-NF4]CEL12792.1 cytochrome P450 [Kibdelosporangium sp. MJ126-NF4]